jgi:hypothetical protein
MVVGAFGGVALPIAAWWRSASRLAVLSLVALGTVPFAALGWTAVVPVLLAVFAGLLTLPVLRTRGRFAGYHSQLVPSPSPSRP